MFLCSPKYSAASNLDPVIRSKSEEQIIPQVNLNLRSKSDKSVNVFTVNKSSAIK